MTQLNMLSAEPKRLTAANGAFVELSAHDQGQATFKLYNTQHELIVDFDPGTGRVRLTAPSGDLEISSPGRLALSAAESISLESPDVQIQTDNGIHLEVAKRSSVQILENRLHLASDNLDVVATRGRFNILQSELLGRSAALAIGSIQTAAKLIETNVERLVTHASNMFETISGTKRTRTERLKTEVADTHHVTSRNSYWTSKEKVKINGENIHLG